MIRWIKHIWSNLFVRCPKTNKLRGINFNAFSKLFFPILGLFSLVWLLIRVIPKPSRVGYPCIKVAAPIAYGFLLYIGGLAASVFAFKKAKQRFGEKKYVLMTLFILLGFAGSLMMVSSNDLPASAEYLHEDLTPNEPIGEAKGVLPGRVVWAWNPDATNENCTNSYNKKDGWFTPQNNNQEVIDQMLSDVLQALTGETTDKAAWDAIFRYNNTMRGKGDLPYQEGEIVYIKINATSAYSIDFTDFTPKKGVYGIAESNPHLVLAVMRQLVNVAGVNPLDIYVGDPLKHVYKHAYELWTAEFPDITVLDHSKSHLGRQRVVEMDEPIMKYSDRGKVMHTGSWDDPMAGDPTVEDFYYMIADVCDYLINIPTMKGHKRAGITMFAKNHFGSHTRNNAVHLHGGLVNPTEQNAYRQGRNLYRVQVDIMGHKIHYHKGLFYLMDALYSGSEATHPPRKFKMAPFNDDWTSSLFLSLDPVAIESVGYDFLRTEFHKDSQYPYPSMGGVDDYLHQAADKSEWPEGIVYDPEDDGTPIPSLGVHEHWNNPVDKQYTRNLGTGDGIELVQIKSTTNVKQDEQLVEAFELKQNYPNPFNPSTTIRANLDKPANVQLHIFNMTGQLVYSFNEQYQDRGTVEYTWNGTNLSGGPVPSGVYIYQVMVDDGVQHLQSAKQMVLLK